MSKQLSAEWQQKIESDMHEISKKFKTDTEYGVGYDHGFHYGYSISAANYVPQLVEAQERINKLETALKNIQHPLKYLQEQANAEGSRLNGIYPVQLSESAAFLKGIAAKALSPNNKQK